MKDFLAISVAAILGANLRYVLSRVAAREFGPVFPYGTLIINILGMEEEYPSPGAVVFVKDGREWRLDAVLEQPDDRELFIMFHDATSGHETYGAGRFLYSGFPDHGLDQPGTLTCMATMWQAWGTKPETPDAGGS